MKRVLFVDDAPEMLDGLRNRLHRHRHEWEMVFVHSGAAALGELERGRFDMIVSDLRMPGMDGADLLHTVNKRWPEIIRIVLSGYIEQDRIAQLVPIAHQYLSKPCEAKRLENVIERCFALGEFLQRPALKAVVGRVKKLPTLPNTYARLRTTLAVENVAVKDVVDVVSADPVIAAKVLQVVNSAFFRLARPIAQIERAVTYLGFSAIRDLVLSVEIFSQWPKQNARYGIDPLRLQSHALAVAAAAQCLGGEKPLSDDALLAGLLHDIGHWVLLQECPEDLVRAHELARAAGIPMHEAETQVIGASHAEVGAYLLGIWGLPFSVVEAVAHHGRPHAVKQTEFDVLAALVVAHALELPREAGPLEDVDDAETALAPDYLKSINAPFDWHEAQRRVALISNREAARR
jgi:HD-like signal output (HDOD) protein/ActR/RegA family two-component response regulator